MDLREKPGKLQKILELSMRFRLISVVLLVILTVTFAATGFQQMNRLPLAASESLGMWYANAEGLAGIWNSAQYLIVAAVAMVVMLFVFGGLRGGLGGLVSLAMFAASLFSLGGSEGMQIVFFGVFAVISLLLLIIPAVKLSVACALFPFALCWLFLTGIIAKVPFMVGEDWLVWGVLSAVGFAGTMAMALVAGKELGAGAPQAGSLVKAFKKMVLPMTISSLLAMVAITADMGNLGGSQIASAVAIWVIFNVWYFVFLFGTCAFAPWERLRSGSRRVEMKDKKKKTAGKK